MIRFFSSKAARWLLHAGAISVEDKGLFEYGIYSIVFTSIPLILVLIVGSFFHMVFEGVLMILPFMLIRKFCGGFHLRSPAACLIVSTAVLTAFLAAIRFTLYTQCFHWNFIMLLASFFLISKLSPVDSENRRLTIAEKKLFKRIAITLAGFFVLLYIVLVLLGQVRAAVSVGSGVILSAALQIPCLIRYKGFRV